MNSFQLGGYVGSEWYDWTFYLNSVGFKQTGIDWGWVFATTDKTWRSDSYGWRPWAQYWSRVLTLEKIKLGNSPSLVLRFNTTVNPLLEKTPSMPNYPNPPCYILALCAYWPSHTDPCTYVALCPNITETPTAATDSDLQPVPGLTLGPRSTTKVKIKILNKRPDTDEWFQVTTGVSGKNNNWLLMVEQAANATKADCVVCMGPRPLLQIVPAPIPAECLLTVMSKTVPGPNCSYWDGIFPVTKGVRIKPLFPKHVAPGNFSCINLTGRGTRLGSLAEIACPVTLPVFTPFTPVSRADIWWWCGDERLFDKLPKGNTGLCALVTLLLPVNVYPISADALYTQINSTMPSEWRQKRSSWRSETDPTYIDAIGVPRGVPDKYKIADQVAAGFESLFCWWCTINKNVDRINYIHYNVQKLGNWTQSGFEAVHGQLSSTSLMAFQNRIALDMLLAEKGGVCAMFREQCCTFIPNNTAADGSLTKAIEGLKTLNGKMKDQSGVDGTMWDSWLDAFGKYRTLVSSILISLAVFAAILTLCGCCCIPCLRSLSTRLITTAIAPMEDRLTQMYPLLQQKQNDDEDTDDESEYWPDLFPDPGDYESPLAG
ncbi:uncharacterized protein LOC122864394 isoform X2 [Siniperca chuatsi]|uniref:uncharacterized protein LOC122864394 isoform X2 n=1 Tax=Siniperca chuatsi TaxID=119488 RepID=UPI001CE16927|nr:uncharacterized protein LOC122864394 isoform X2 [Siniperca chuatsi]